MDHEKIKKQQSEILQKIKTHFNNTQNVNGESLLKSLMTSQNFVAAMNYSMGEWSHQFRKFLYEIDVTHPDLQSIKNGVLSNDSEIIQVIMEVFKMVKSLTDSNNDGKNNFILNNIHSIISRHPRYKDIISLFAPSENLQNIRFASDVYRQNLREKKMATSIGFGAVVRNNDDLVKESPDDLMPYCRYSNPQSRVAEEGRQHKENLERIGLTSLAEQINIQTLKLMTAESDKCYYGFNALKPYEAAATLFKILGGRQEVVQSFNGDSTSTRYLLPLEEYERDSPFFKGMVKKYHPSQLPYSPQMVPYHNHCATIPMREIIRYVERFPDANHKPIFDYFWVVEPRFDFGYDSVSAFHHLVSENCMCGVLLGEKDGVTYFISYWI